MNSAEQIRQKFLAVKKVREENRKYLAATFGTFDPVRRDGLLKTYEVVVEEFIEACEKLGLEEVLREDMETIEMITHKERRRIRETILNKAKAGASIKELITEYGYSRSCIYKILEQGSILLERKKAHNLKLSALCRSGLTYEELEARSGVPRTKLLKFCRTRGIKIPRKPFISKNLIWNSSVLKKIDWSRRGSDLAREMNISRQRVHQIKKAAIKKGILKGEG